MSSPCGIMTRRAVVLSLIMGILLSTLGCGTRTYRCPTRGMMPTLYVGDVFRARLNPYKATSPARGDIVVLAVPAGHSWAGKEVLKRIVGLPGETFEIREFQVFVNGEKLDEEYARLPDDETRGGLPTEMRNTPKMEIPPGRCFVLGDNRGNSVDSRHFGPVDVGAIVAKALVVVKSDHKEQEGRDLTVVPY